MSNATASNPLIKYGDFSKYNAIAINGQYASSTVGHLSGCWKNIVKGQITTYKCGENGTYQSYRDITVYDDRLEIGNGYYNTGSSTTTSSSYGCMTSLVLFTLSD